MLSKAAHNCLTDVSCLQRIMHENLRFHLCKIHATHELKELDKTSCVNLYRQFLDIVNTDEGVLNILIMSDEAHCHFSSYVNTQFQVLER
jgi:hypothetical protein